MLKKKHDSILRNPLIANSFFLIKYIEKWGRVISLILSKEPDADFKEVGRQFISIFKRKEVTPQVTPQVRLTELESKILDKIKKNSRISRSQLSKELNISAYTVKEYVKRLKKKNMSKARRHCQSQTGSGFDLLTLEHILFHYKRHRLVE